MTLQPGLLAIPFVVLVLAGILCWALVYGRGSWRLKLGVIVIAPTLSLVVWSAFPSYMGWPTTNTPDKKVLLLAGSVREPDLKTNDDGAIYLWAVPLVEHRIGPDSMLDFKSARGEPRAYELPYSRKSHELLMQALQRTKNGEQIVLEMTGLRNGRKGRRGIRRDGRPGQQLHGDVQRDDELEFRMYKLPNASYPEKREE